jgi:DNA repair protein RadA/Sms
VAKTRDRYVCQSCGDVSNKWSGRCDSCGEWNSIVEEIPMASIPKGMKAGKGKAVELVDLRGEAKTTKRWLSGIGEFDRTCGGGVVPASAVLIGGDPGIGKSTVLLQAVAGLAGNGLSCLYISGEESVAQIRLRATRLGLEDAPLKLGSETNLRNILSTIEEEKPDIVVIDSIQTMFVDTVESAPGSVSQVRASAQEIIRLAKRTGFAVLLVGHVTKDGQIAGPRVLEHMVDTVLYFEGDRGHQFRILRPVKNRFGGTDEIGVFEMSDQGLNEVPNPSALFLTSRSEEVSGAAVFAGMEGTRPILVEIQALASPSNLATPRRAVVGWDSGRLAMIMAVLEARCGMSFAGLDVYLNVAGGLRIMEPAADLAVAGALMSAMSTIAIPQDAVLFGEISLAGEVRPVSQASARLKEAAKLGFSKAWMPSVPQSGEKRSKADQKLSLDVFELDKVGDLRARFASE